MELAAHSRHASAEKMFHDIVKGPSRDMVLRRQESCLSGKGESVSASAQAHLRPGLRYLEKRAQESLPSLWVPGQLG